MSTDTQSQPMLDEPVGTGPSRTPTAVEYAARRARLLEVAVVVLILAPSALSFVSSASNGGAGFELTAIATMLHDIGLVALVALLVWRSAEPLTALGWRLQRPGREVMIGLLAFPVLYVFVEWFEVTLRRMGVPGPARAATFLQPDLTTGQLLTAVVLVGVVAIAEESVFRGYLMLRFGQITGSVVTAVVASSFVFALGHGYEGLSGAIGAGVFGALMAVLYRWRGSLIAPIIVHFLQDFTAIVLLTALHH
jgi:membrane protease YdiL (CAAX protease family)